MPRLERSFPKPMHVSTIGSDPRILAHENQAPIVAPQEARLCVSDSWGRRGDTGNVSAVADRPVARQDFLANANEVVEHLRVRQHGTLLARLAMSSGTPGSSIVHLF